jgi:hypothetical protein
LKEPVRCRQEPVRCRQELEQQKQLEEQSSQRKEQPSQLELEQQQRQHCNRSKVLELVCSKHCDGQEGVHGTAERSRFQQP